MIVGRVWTEIAVADSVGVMVVIVVVDNHKIVCW